MNPTIATSVTFTDEEEIDKPRIGINYEGNKLYAPIGLGWYGEKKGLYSEIYSGIHPAIWGITHQNKERTKHDNEVTYSVTATFSGTTLTIKSIVLNFEQGIYDQLNDLIEHGDHTFRTTASVEYMFLGYSSTIRFSHDDWANKTLFSSSEVSFNFGSNAELFINGGYAIALELPITLASGTYAGNYPILSILLSKPVIDGENLTYQGSSICSVPDEPTWAPQGNYRGVSYSSSVNTTAFTYNATTQSWAPRIGDYTPYTNPTVELFVANYDEQTVRSYTQGEYISVSEYIVMRTTYYKKTDLETPIIGITFMFQNKNTGNLEQAPLLSLQTSVPQWLYDELKE